MLLEDVYKCALTPVEELRAQLIEKKYVRVDELILLEEKHYCSAKKLPVFSFSTFIGTGAKRCAMCHNFISAYTWSYVRYINIELVKRFNKNNLHKQYSMYFCNEACVENMLKILQNESASLRDILFLNFDANIPKCIRIAQRYTSRNVHIR